MATRRLNNDDDYLDYIGRNMHPYKSRFDKGATNSAVGTTFEDVWDVGGRMTWLTAQSTLNVVSSSASDTVGGVGASYIIIYGVDADYEVVSEVVAMNGTSTVTTTANFFRVNSAQFVNAGSTGYNVGNITITATTGGSVQAFLEAEVGVHHSMNFAVPAGYTLVLYDITTVSEAAQGVLLCTFVRAVGAGLPFWACYTDEVVAAGTKVRANRSIPSVFPEKTDVNPRVKKISGSSGYFNMGYSGYLIKGDQDSNPGRPLSIGL